MILQHRKKIYRVMLKNVKNNLQVCFQVKLYYTFIRGFITLYHSYIDVNEHEFHSLFFHTCNTLNNFVNIKSNWSIWSIYQDMYTVQLQFN